MAFCKKCGTQVGDGVTVCPNCGESLTAEQATQATAAQQNNFAATVAGFNQTADTTAEFDAQDIETNKVMGVLSYISWLVLVPLFAAPKSKFARFHANQGLVLAIAEIAWWIVSAVLSMILTAISWHLAFISTIFSLLNIVFVVLAVIGIMNALNGKAKELPVIGKFRILK